MPKTKAALTFVAQQQGILILDILKSKIEEVKHSIANSSLFPTSLYLHSNSTKILALKIWFFWKKKSSPKK